MPRPLRISACKSLCSWRQTEDFRDGETVFACTGCGSEWVPTEAWTPIDWTGAVPEAVQQARDQQR